jgi:hypothetical protein
MSIRPGSAVRRPPRAGPPAGLAIACVAALAALAAAAA